MSIASVKAVVNGTTYTLTYNSTTGKWEASLTAPSLSSYNQSGHYYNVALTATNAAGSATTIDAADATFGNDLKFVVKEKVGTVCSVTSPGSGAYLNTATPTVTATVTDEDSGVDLSSAILYVDGTANTYAALAAAGATFTAITNGWKISYTLPAVTDGAHTLSLSCNDNDGNTGTSATVNYRTDTVHPTLSVTTPTDNYTTNSRTVHFAGNTTDSSAITLTLTKDGGSPVTETVTDGAFDFDVTETSDGAYGYTVTATDAAGNVTTVHRTVTIDTTSPVFTAVSISPNPADAGATYIISVSVS